ncbi:MAG: DUF3794 domain-containing protein [Oscillospiraceae bacterium]
MEKMNNDNTIRTEAVVYDGQAEQGIELDYVLPDYYPEIFKVLKCSLTPAIVSKTISGDNRLLLDGVVYIRVMYLTENSDELFCVEQRTTWSKAVELGKKPIEGEPLVKVSAKADYCNCRAVSSRRIDVRGAISCKIRINGMSAFELPELPDNLIVRKKEITACPAPLSATKQYNIREEIETGAKGITFILTTDTVPTINDVRIIADKAVIKGSINVSALYGIKSDGTGCKDFEKMSADIPISQILDIRGIDDTFVCIPEISVMNCELIPSADSGILSCEITGECRIKAYREEKILLPIDVYSTQYETEHTSANLKCISQPKKINEQLTLRSSVSSGMGEFEAVWDSRCELSNLVCHAEQGLLTLTGQLISQAIGKVGGLPCYAEKNEAFESKINNPDITPDTLVEFTAQPTGSSFSITNDGAVGISTLVDFNGCLLTGQNFDVLKSVNVMEDKPRARDEDIALRIIYTNGTEDCWSLAKRCGTTVESLMNENSIESDDTPISGMVIIPNM